MATPIIDNLLLPRGSLLVLPDVDDKPTTGVIERVSEAEPGRAKFFASAGGTSAHPTDVGTHVLFLREMATEVEVDGVEYMAMHVNAVVGLIP